MKWCGLQWIYVKTYKQNIGQQLEAHCVDKYIVYLLSYHHQQIQMGSNLLEFC